VQPNFQKRLLSNQVELAFISCIITGACNSNTDCHVTKRALTFRSTHVLPKG